jgi:hypothetical protein
MKFITRVTKSPFLKFVIILISFLNLYNEINAIKIKKFSLENREGENILKRIIKYQEIEEKVNNPDFIRNLINNPQNKNEIESHFNKYPKEKFKEISSNQDSEIQSYINQVKENSADAKKVLDMTINFLAKDEKIKNVLIKNKKYFLKFLEESEKYNKSNFMRFSQLDIIGIEDLPPPMPYMSLDIPCMTTADCTAKKLLWMKCTVQRVGIRTAYEGLNVALSTMNKMLFGTCVCVQIPMGPDKLQCKCNNTTAQPSLACVIPNQVFKQMFKMSVEMWKAYQMISHSCFSPINPLG